MSKPHIKHTSPGECSGCGACIAVCPVKSIDFSEDPEGFLYPKVKSNCIQCGKCVEICPFLSSPKILHDVNFPLVYAAWIKDLSVRQKSSSGGIFGALATQVIENGGHVFGAGFDSNLKLNHYDVENKADLESLMGSKYFQSNTNDSFRKVRALLQQNIFVMFCGTPCQIAGLRNYIGEHNKNLLLVDFVCHGVPSPRFFQRYREFCEFQKSEKLIDFKFRLTRGWGYGEERHWLCANGKTKIQTISSVTLSPYLQVFMHAENYRYSCYQCPFANIERPGDITICDFWGAEKFLDYHEYRYGVSGVMVHNSIGQYWWNKISEHVIYKPQSLTTLVAKNENLKAPVTCPGGRSDFYVKWDKYSPETFLYQYSSPKQLRRSYLRMRIVSVLQYLRISGMLKQILFKLGIRLS